MFEPRGRLFDAFDLVCSTVVLWSTVEYCGVLCSTVEYCGVLGSTVEYWGVLGSTGEYWGTVEYCGVLWSTGEYWGVLGYCRVLWSTVEYCGVLGSTAPEGADAASNTVMMLPWQWTPSTNQSESSTGRLRPHAGDDDRTFVCETTFCFPKLHVKPKLTDTGFYFGFFISHLVFQCSFLSSLM